MLTCNTGVLFGLTQFKADFFDYVECDIPINGVTKSKKFIYIGTTIHKLKGIKGYDAYLLYVFYHLLTDDNFLFSTQT